MADLQREAQVRTVKDAINLALDNIEEAGLELAEFTPPGKDSLSERLGGIFDDLDRWKADAWEAMG